MTEVLRCPADELIDIRIKLTVAVGFIDKNGSTKHPQTVKGETVAAMLPKEFYYGVTVNALEDAAEGNKVISELMSQIPNICPTDNDADVERRDDNEKNRKNSEENVR